MLTLIIANALVGHLALGTCDGLCVCLPLERLAVVARTLVIHGFLQRIAFPAVSESEIKEHAKRLPFHPKR